MERIRGCGALEAKIELGNHASVTGYLGLSSLLSEVDLGVMDVATGILRPHSNFSLSGLQDLTISQKYSEEERWPTNLSQSFPLQWQPG